MAAYSHSIKIESEFSRLPLVSVLLPVYNCENYIEDAVKSIISQTYNNFELIIVNDGSIDKTAEVINNFNDYRIRVYNQTNQGLAASLNRAIRLAEGKYLARQDADDISFPTRIEKQVEFMESHSDYGVVGTWSEIWEEDKKSNRGHRHPQDNIILKFNLLFDTYFVHSSVMFRKTVFDKVGLYSTDKARQPEDFELWSRIVRDEVFKVANIPDVLVSYREVANSICRKGNNPFCDRMINMCAENLAWATGRDISDPVINDISSLMHGVTNRLSSNPDFRAMQSALQKAAIRINNSSNILDSPLNAQVHLRYTKIRRMYLKYRIYSLINRAVSVLKGLKNE